MLIQIFLFFCFTIILCKYIGILGECEINIMKCFFLKTSTKFARLANVFLYTIPNDRPCRAYSANNANIEILGNRNKAYAVFY